MTVDAAKATSEHFYKFMPIIDGIVDRVSESRLIGSSSELQGGFDECFRLMGSSLITACINHRFHVRLSESQNGFRAIRTAVLRDLGLEENITTIEQEMIIKTLKKATEWQKFLPMSTSGRRGIRRSPSGRSPSATGGA